MNNKPQEILKIPFRIVIIFIVLIFAGVYWVQTKFCPCDDSNIQIIAQYTSFGAFGEIFSAIVIAAGAAAFACLGYRMMETVLRLSADQWGKNTDSRSKIIRRNNIAVFIVSSVMMLMTAAGIIGYIWADANTYAVITEDGYSKKGIFNDFSYKWEDAENFLYEDEGESKVICTFKDGKKIKIVTEKFNHSTDSFNQEYKSLEEFFEIYIFKKYDGLENG